VDAKTRILEAAVDLLSRSADPEISTREVCEVAGITAPALYHHFGDKERLLSAVVDRGWARFLESKRAQPRSTTAESSLSLSPKWW